MAIAHDVCNSWATFVDGIDLDHLSTCLLVGRMQKITVALSLLSNNYERGASSTAFDGDTEQVVRDAHSYRHPVVHEGPPEPKKRRQNGLKRFEWRLPYHQG